MMRCGSRRVTNSRNQLPSMARRAFTEFLIFRPSKTIALRFVTKRKSKEFSNSLFDDFEARKPQGLNRACQLAIAHQNVVCFKGPNRQNTDVGLSEWHCYRNQASDEIQIQRSHDLEPSPSSARFGTGGNKVFLTNH